MHRLFADASVASVLGKVGDVAVHLPVDLDMLDHILPVGLQPAVHVMEMDAGSAPRRPVVQFRGQVLRQGIVLAFLFPSGHEVIALLADHPDHFRNLLGGVLQVRVHGHDNLALGGGKALVQGCRFAVIPPERDAVDSGMGVREGADHLPGAVRGAIIHKDYFEGKALFEHNLFDPGVEFREGFRLIVKGYDD